MREGFSANAGKAWGGIAGNTVAEEAKILCDFRYLKARDMEWIEGVPEDYFRATCALMQSRTHVFTDAKGWGYFFSEDFEYNEKAVKKCICKEGHEEAFRSVLHRLEAGDFTEESIEQAIRATEKDAGIKEGKLNQPMRVALTGSPMGAGIYETAAHLGRDRVTSRLRAVITRFFDD